MRFRLSCPPKQCVDPNLSCSLDRGFTLIELLVVISIISVLIAILLPVMGRAQDAARQIQCLSKYRQYGLAAMMYAEDYRGYNINEHDHVDHSQMWPHRLAVYLTGAQRPSPPGELYVCPQMNLNVPFDLTTNARWWTTHPGLSQYVGYDKYSKMDDVKHPSRGAIFADWNHTDRGIRGGLFNDLVRESRTFTHSQSENATAVFLDGHAQPINREIWEWTRTWGATTDPQNIPTIWYPF